MAKDVGAKKVIVASCAPPIRYVQDTWKNKDPLGSSSLRFPNVYGIDMPSRKELVAFGRDEQSIAEAIGADHVIFQTLPDLVNSARQWNPKITAFDCSVFNGEYVTGGVSEEYLQHLESLRADNVRGKLELDTSCLAPTTNGVKPTKTEENGDSRSNYTNVSTPGSDDTVGLHNTFTTYAPK